MARFLSGPHSSFVNGQVIDVNGGSARGPREQT